MNILKKCFGDNYYLAVEDIQKIANMVYRLGGQKASPSLHGLHCYIKIAQGKEGGFIPSFFNLDKGEVNFWLLLTYALYRYLVSNEFEWASTTIENGKTYHDKGVCFFGYNGIVYATSGGNTDQNFLMCVALAAYFNGIKSFGGEMFPGKFNVDFANEFLDFMYPKLGENRFFFPSNI